MKQDLRQTILALHKQSAALEPNEAQRTHWLQTAQQFSDKFLNSISDAPGYAAAASEGNFDLNSSTTSIENLIQLYETEVVHKGIYAASGGHLGYIPGGGIYASAIADYLADVSNEYSGMYFASPGAVSIENAVLDWMKSLFGFPASAVGNLSSGGSIANLIALTAARDAHGVKGSKVEKSVLYLSAQVHHCIHKALRIIGLEDVIVREIPLDAQHRLKVENIQLQIRKDKADGLQPFLVIASAGTTDTGAIDPLAEIASLAQKEGLWFHIDAAYGGFFMLLDQIKPLFKGIEQADSLVVDPHKGLFLPYGTGAVLVKDKSAVLHSNFYRANYMLDAIDDSLPVNPADVSPELTKHFRGLRIWLPLQLHGIEPFQACLEEKIYLTQYFREGLADMGFELGPEPDLTVSYFWYPAKETDINAFNEELMARIQKDGRVFLSSTRLDGKFVIRMAILSFRTKLETVDRALDMIRDILNELKKEGLT